MLRVQKKQCATCIFRKDSSLNLKHLLDAVRDPRMAGHFKGHRICHHSRDAVCAGFWSRFKDHFDLGQIAQRMRCVQYVQDDTLNLPTRKAKHEQSK